MLELIDARVLEYLPWLSSHNNRTGIQIKSMIVNSTMYLCIHSLSDFLSKVPCPSRLSLNSSYLPMAILTTAKYFALF